MKLLSLHDMSNRDWRDYRAFRRQQPKISDYNCLNDSCLMYAMNINDALTMNHDNQNRQTHLLQQIAELPGVSFEEPVQPIRKLALFFSRYDFHFARLDNNIWTEKFRQQPPTRMQIDERGRPVSRDKAYKFSRYLYITPANALDNEQRRKNRSRYDRHGMPTLYVRRGPSIRD